MAKYEKVLYFVKGNAPSEKDLKAAAEFGPGVRFRNAVFIRDNEPLENCDRVAGPAIPPKYKEAFNTKGGAEKHANDIARGAPAISKASEDRKTDGWTTG